jgi:hypothetical protein
MMTRWTYFLILAALCNSVFFVFQVMWTSRDPSVFARLARPERIQNYLKSAIVRGETTAKLPTTAPSFLRQIEFDLCGSYADQVLSLFYGIVLGLESGRAVILPEVLLSEAKGDIADSRSKSATYSEPLEALWDTSSLLKVLIKHQVAHTRLGLDKGSGEVRRSSSTRVYCPGGIEKG